MMESSHLYINALGIVNALGGSGSDIINSMAKGEQFSVIKRNNIAVDRDVYVAEFFGSLPCMGNVESKLVSRNNQMLMAALLQIESDIKDLMQRYGSDRIAVVMGTSTSGIFETEQALSHQSKVGDLPDDYHYSKQEMGSPAEFVASYFALTNIALTVSTACSSSAKVFSTARDLIDAGFADAAIVGGVDTLCQMTINGFSSLESVSKGICNPFSVNREGITIGEGAAVFVLSPNKGAVELLGIGESSDAHHMSAPSPDGSGAESAIMAALQDAALKPDDIDYINLHGTATVKNDEMEAAVVNRIFGAQLPCSSTKPMTGHTLGAAGATEIGLCYLLLSSAGEDVCLPVNLWDGEKDVALPELNLVKKNTQVSLKQCSKVMSNSFAFGGSNVSVILGRGDL